MQSDKKSGAFSLFHNFKECGFLRSFFLVVTHFKLWSFQKEKYSINIPAKSCTSWWYRRMDRSLFRTRSCSWPHFFSFDLSLILAHMLAHFHAPILFLPFSRSGSRFRFCTRSHSRSLSLSSSNKKIYKMNI